MKKNEKWECKSCGKIFQTATQLKQHKSNNPWERYLVYLKTKKIYRCIICKNIFKSMEEFKSHWDVDHDSYAEERKWLSSKRKKDVVYTIRPLEEELIKHNLRTDKAYLALRNDITVNELVMAEIEHGIENEAMTVVEIVGIPGAGKSIFALTLARIIQMKWLDKILRLFKQGKIKEAYTPKIFVGFDLESTLRYLRTARMGDVIIQDEDPQMMGVHSSSSKGRIENVMKIMRKACINFIFVSPVSTPYINMPNLVFEVIAKNKKLRRTKAALYDRKYHAVGWVIMQVLDEDDELLIAYNEMKDSNLERIKESGGRRSYQVSEEQLMEDVKKLLNSLKKTNYNFSKSKHSLADLTQEALRAGVEGDAAYQRYVAVLVRNIIIEQMQDFIDEMDNIDRVENESKYLFIKEKEFIDREFLKDIYEAYEEAYKSIKKRGSKKGRPLRKFKPKHAKAWYHYYYEGLSYDKVGGILGVSGQSIGNHYDNHGYTAIFQEELSGECAEIALMKRYFPDYKQVGGHGMPDLVNKNDKNDWIEVKLRRRLEKKKEDLVRKFEYEFVDRGGKLKLVLITYKPRHCVITVYRVILNPNYKTVDEIIDSLDDEEEDTTEENEVTDEIDLFDFDN